MSASFFALNCIQVLVTQNTDTPLTGGVNNTDYLFMSPVNGWVKLGNKGTFCPGKMGKCKDLKEFEKGQTAMARGLGQNISKT